METVREPVAQQPAPDAGTWANICPVLATITVDVVDGQILCRAAAGARAAVVVKHSAVQLGTRPAINLAGFPWVLLATCPLALAVLLTVARAHPPRIVAGTLAPAFQAPRMASVLASGVL